MSFKFCDGYIKITDDTSDISLPKASNKLSIIDNITEDKTPKALLVTVPATHGGFINKNNVLYLASGMRDSVVTWTKPYPAPILKDHIAMADNQIGRVTLAEFKQTSSYGKDSIITDMTLPQCYHDVSFISQNKDAIQRFLSKDYLTFSIGAEAREVRCGIPWCSKDIANEGPCEHIRGKIYTHKDDDGNVLTAKCFYIVSGMSYCELSVVTHPADPYAIATSVREFVKQADSVQDFHLASTAKIAALLNDSCLISITDSIDINLFDKMTQTEKNNLETVLKDSIYIPNKEGQDMSIKKDEEASKDSQETENKDQQKPEENKQEDATTSKVDLSLLDCEGLGDMSKSEKTELLTILAQDASGEELDVSDYWTLDNYLMLEMESDESIKDSKLSAKQRKDLPAKAFCGPNRSFPVPDCAHVTAAKKLIGRYKGEGSKSKILACVNRKAKALSCDSSKDSKPENNQEDLLKANDLIKSLQEQLDSITKEKDSQVEKVTSLEKEVQERKDEIETLETKVLDLNGEIHTLLASIIVDQKVQKGVLKLDSQEKYEETITDLAKRSRESLNDALNDIKATQSTKQTIPGKVENPLNDKVNNKDNKKTEDVPKEAPETFMVDFISSLITSSFIK